MTDDLLLPAPGATIMPAPHGAALAIRGAQADAAAHEVVIAEYRSRQTPNTRLRHDTDLKLFADFLVTVGVVVPVDEKEVPILATDPHAWAGMTAGVVMAFRTWMLAEGYAIGSVNVRLSTVRTYARLAHLASVLSADVFSRIQAVSGYRRGEGNNLDQQRTAAAQPTRVSTKKSTAQVLAPAQISELKHAAYHNPTGQTPEVQARDALLVCLLVDLGLRCGEVALLRWESLHEDLLTVARPKVKTVQRHRLVGDVPTALARYRAVVAAPDDRTQPLIVAFDQHGNKTGFGLSERAIRKRIQQLGKLIGIPNLAPHDLRHSWATRLAQTQVAIQDLRDAGGWANFTTPARYIAHQAIANDRIGLGADMLDDAHAE